MIAFRFRFTILLVLFAVLAVPELRAQSAGDPAAATATVESPDAVVHVEGLACEMCARSLSNTLREVEGVVAVEVRLGDDQRALLALAPDARTDEAALREAVERAGFITRRVVFVTADTSKQRKP